MLSITTDLAAAKHAVASLNASDGFDNAEANLVALYCVASGKDIAWRPVSRRVVMYVADNPGHEPSCGDNETVLLTRTDVRDALNAEGITVIAVSYPVEALDRRPTAYNCGDAAQPAQIGQGSFLTSQTGGVYLGGRLSEFDTSAIVNALRSL